MTPAVRQLATEIAEQSTDPRSILNAFWRFLFHNLKNGYLHHAELDQNDPLLDIVRRGWFDCLGGPLCLSHYAEHGAFRLDLFMVSYCTN